MVRLSIVVPVLNSHEIVRRQLLYLQKIGIPDDVEIIYMDDGSDPPLVDTIGVPSLSIHATRDTRPWTWAVARNAGARVARGTYLLMTDIDYILPRKAMEAAVVFGGDYMGFRRAFGVVDEDGNFTQDGDVLQVYGLSPGRYATRGAKLSSHPNNFTIRRDLFFEMGGYREDLVSKPYPHGEDNKFKATRSQWREQGKLKESKYRPLIYMFPNGQFCGDVDYNPFGLFHDLTRKTDANYWYLQQQRGISR